MTPQVPPVLPVGAYMGAVYLIATLVVAVVLIIFGKVICHFIELIGEGEHGRIEALQKSNRHHVSGGNDGDRG